MVCVSDNPSYFSVSPGQPTPPPLAQRRDSTQSGGFTSPCGAAVVPGSELWRARRSSETQVQEAYYNVGRRLSTATLPRAASRATQQGNTTNFPLLSIPYQSAPPPPTTAQRRETFGGSDSPRGAAPVAASEMWRERRFSTETLPSRASSRLGSASQGNHITEYACLNLKGCM